jgi:parvulin-like peptidyl-prolyl isomerase
MKSKTVFLLLSIILLSGCGNGDDTAAWINGEPVSARELKFHMDANRSWIFGYFREKHGVDINPAFWESSYDGESTQEKARQKAMADLAGIKVAQILAKSLDLAGDISFSGFLDSLEKENRRRASARQNGEVIYGPERYSETTYYDYVQSNLVLRMKEKLAGTRFNAPGGQLREYYFTVRDRVPFFRQPDLIRVEQIRIPFGNEAERDSAFRKIGELSKQSSRESFSLLGTEYSGITVFDDTTIQKDTRLRPALLEAAMELAAGQVSGIIEEQGAFYLLKCLERKARGYKPFEEVEKETRSLYVDEKYDGLIRDLTAAAMVRINEQIYRTVLIKDAD